MKRPFVRQARIGIALALSAASVMALAGCGGDDSADAGSGDSAKQVNLVAFSVVKSAYDALGESFAKTSAGDGVTIKSSYGASGAQSRAVIAGQKADLIVLSLTPDVTKIVDAGLIDASWDSDANKGIVSDSVVVLAVRPGNPKGIKGWDDIVKPGVGIVTADPGTSGSAKWNLLGAYTQALGDTNDKAAGTAYLKKFIASVVSWNDSGRTATEAFLNGTGDVLISYENEAIAARAAGTQLDYILPDTTFLIENPAAVSKTASPAAKDFLTYIKSPEGQAILGSKGFRPIGDAPAATNVEGANDPANPFPAVTKLWTIADLGGWKTVDSELFDKENGLVTELRK